MKIPRVLIYFLIAGAMLVVQPAGPFYNPYNRGIAVAAQAMQTQETFERYRKAIKDAFGIDIKNFKGKLPGGEADGKPLTNYDLNQLLMGIKVELEHTSDRMLALEIATDHLEEFPDYYTRLKKMEEEAEKDKRRATGK
jgi:hypothetical protein